MLKLLINVAATAVLLLYMQTLSYLSDVAARTSGLDLGGLRDPHPTLHAGGGLLLLLVAATLSVYKPQGLTRYGRRKREERRAVSQP